MNANNGAESEGSDKRPTPARRRSFMNIFSKKKPPQPEISGPVAVTTSRPATMPKLHTTTPRVNSPTPNGHLQLQLPLPLPGMTVNQRHRRAKSSGGPLSNSQTDREGRMHSRSQSFSSRAEKHSSSPLERSKTSISVVEFLSASPKNTELPDGLPELEQRRREVVEELKRKKAPVNNQVQPKPPLQTPRRNPTSPASVSKEQQQLGASAFHPNRVPRLSTPTHEGFRKPPPPARHHQTSLRHQPSPLHANRLPAAQQSSPRNHETPPPPPRRQPQPLSPRNGFFPRSKNANQVGNPRSYAAIKRSYQATRRDRGRSSPAFLSSKALFPSVSLTDQYHSGLAPPIVSRPPTKSPPTSPPTSLPTSLPKSPPKSPPKLPTIDIPSESEPPSPKSEPKLAPESLPHVPPRPRPAPAKPKLRPPGHRRSESTPVELTSDNNGSRTVPKNLLTQALRNREKKKQAERASLKVDTDCDSSNTDSESKQQQQPSTPKDDQHIRKKVLAEIINTEAVYVMHLNEIIDWFLIPLRRSRLTKDPLLTEKQELTIFSNIENLRECHTLFLEELREATNLSKVFIKYASFFKLTSAFASNYERSQKMLAKLQKRNQMFQSVVADVLRDKNLSKHLIFPIQQLPRYVLLLAELRKRTPKDHPEYNDVETALAKCDEATRHVDNYKKDCDNALKLARLQGFGEDQSRSFFANGTSLKLLKPGCKLIHEGTVFLKPLDKARLTERSLLLATDVIIWGIDARTPEGNMGLKECEIYFYEEMVYGKLKSGFQLYNEIKKVTFLCESVKEAKDWIDRIETAKYKLAGIDLEDDAVIDMINMF